MRSSDGTNLALARSVMSRTKSRIACFAGPSFQDGSAAVGVVPCADTWVGKNGADKAGSNASVESNARRSMTERGISLVMFNPPAVFLRAPNGPNRAAAGIFDRSPRVRLCEIGTLSDVRSGSFSEVGALNRNARFASRCGATSAANRYQDRHAVLMQ